jgi:RHS repeat-associated protein
MSRTTSTTMRRVMRASERVAAGSTAWQCAIAEVGSAQRLNAQLNSAPSAACGWSRAVSVLEGARGLSTGYPLLLRSAWVFVALFALGFPSRADAQTSQTPNFTIDHHHADLSGHIRLTTDEDGAVVREAIHLPFGERDTGECGTREDGARPLGSQGKPRDPKTCLDDFGARDYRAAIGRFQTVDPVLPVERALRDPQQWNRYAYARNNPLIYTDPDGRFIVPALILAVGAVLSYEVVVEAPTTTWPSFEGDRGSLTGLFLHTLDRRVPGNPSGIVNVGQGARRPAPPAHDGRAQSNDRRTSQIDRDAAAGERAT